MESEYQSVLDPEAKKRYKEMLAFDSEELTVWHAVSNKNTLILRSPPNLQELLLSLRGLLVAYKDSS